MFEQIKELTASAVAAIEASASAKDLDNLRVELLGKKGSLTQILKGMGALPAEERPAMGAAANDARGIIEVSLAARGKLLRRAELDERLKGEVLDVTMPGKKQALGARHPMTIVMEDLCNVFIGMGYDIAEGPEIEDIYHSFTALNTAEHHPARDEQDTFYMKSASGTNEYMLRTQTSTVQIHVMEQRKPPIRVICPGKIYRKDEVDATHTPVFHQMEGLVVDKGLTMGDLKGTLTTFAREVFGASTAVRFRPHYFPFTEPSGEMDVRCFSCGGIGCRVCKNEGWIELLGCGMVHPNVLSICGINPSEYTGFAFGMGLDRAAMMRFGITDIRYNFENDVRFLRQFA